MERAPDLRAYAIEAVRDASSGGAFYALMALRECRLAASPGQEGPRASNDTLDPVAQYASDAVLRWRQRRCASFSADEMQPEGAQPIFDEGTRRGDPLLAANLAWNDALESSDVTRVSAALAEVARIGDPLLLQVIGQSGADFLATGIDADVTDENIRQRNRLLRLDAWQLADCSFGARCDADDALVQEICADQGRCYASRIDALTYLRGWLPDDRSRVEQDVAALVNELRAARTAALIGWSTP